MMPGKNFKVPNKHGDTLISLVTEIYINYDAYMIHHW